MTSEIVLVAGVLLFLLAGGFYSGTEMGLYCLNRVRLRVRAERGHEPTARALLGLANQSQDTVLAILLGQNLANYLLTVAASALLINVLTVDPGRADFYTAAMLAPLVFVLGDVVPKNWYRLDADRLMSFSTRPLQISVLLFRLTGALWLLRQVMRLSMQLAGHQQGQAWRGPRAEVLGLLREGAAEGAITEQQARIIEGVMNLSDVCVGSIMVPRQKVVCVPADADRRTFEEVVRGHNYSRMPVLARGCDAVAGIVNVCDVLADESSVSIESWIRPAATIPASETAANALVQLRRERATMAIVTDPRHGFVGMITLKDVAEEIFGKLSAW